MNVKLKLIQISRSYNIKKVTIFPLQRIVDHFALEKMQLQTNLGLKIDILK